MIGEIHLGTHEQTRGGEVNFAVRGDPMMALTHSRTPQHKTLCHIAIYDVTTTDLSMGLTIEL